MGNPDDEPAFASGDGGRADGEGFKSDLGWNQIIGNISASTSLFSQSFHAPPDREERSLRGQLLDGVSLAYPAWPGIGE